MEFTARPTTTTPAPLAVSYADDSRYKQLHRQEMEEKRLKEITKLLLSKQHHQGFPSFSEFVFLSKIMSTANTTESVVHVETMESTAPPTPAPLPFVSYADDSRYKKLHRQEMEEKRLKEITKLLLSKKKRKKK
eukprot:CAMPEP_0170858122 /NCGR_PEP_ID=MMETSP0734-20130129/15756_1 /TAXON_ID=186038 /ORGANISM="Fragilariopsis kerguelensis, Strain L26-C5" /LENGTH=133 /DNA_ID=CAMNT_0011230603 /DNA_START=49 /DNA_END=450 /DNA_ORIENTATION=+